MAYPTVAELKTFLQGANMLDTPLTAKQELLSFDLAMGGAIEDWENVAGRHPFLADSVDTTRYFDPPGPECSPSQLAFWTYVGGGWELALTPGLVSLTSVVLNTTTFVIGGAGAAGQVYLYPENYVALGLPISTLRFSYPIYGVPQQIAVTGKWGYEAVLSDSIKLLLMKKAGLSLLSSMMMLKTEGLTEVKQENVTYKWGGGGKSMWDVARDDWTAEWRTKTNRYKRSAFA